MTELARIAAALEELVAVERERLELERSRRRCGRAATASVAEGPTVDELSMRRAAELLAKAGVGRTRSTPGARRRGKG